MSQPLDSLDGLSVVLARSFTRPILIFKHSSRCGTSAMASEELDELVAGLPDGADVYVIHVQSSREVSDAAARSLAVRHESPQVLLVKNGVVRWSASHFRVTAEAIRRALEALESDRPTPSTSP